MTWLRFPRATLAFVLALLAVPAAAAEETSSPSDPYKSKFSGLPFAYYSPETKLAFGLGGVFNFRAGRNKETARTSSVWVFATYTLARQYSILLKPELYLKNNSLAFFGSLRYERSPQNFYGVGDDTEDAAGE